MEMLPACIRWHCSSTAWGIGMTKSLGHTPFPKQLGLAVSAGVGWGEGLSPTCSSGSDHCYSLLCSASIQTPPPSSSVPALEQHQDGVGRCSSWALWLLKAIQQDQTEAKQEPENCFCFVLFCFFFFFFSSTGVESARNCVLFTDLTQTKMSRPFPHAWRAHTSQDKISCKSFSNSNMKMEPLLARRGSEHISQTVSYSQRQCPRGYAAFFFYWKKKKSIAEVPAQNFNIIQATLHSCLK